MSAGAVTNDHANRMLSLIRALPPETATDVLSDIFMAGVSTAQMHLKEDPLPEVPNSVVEFFRLALGFCFEGHQASKDSVSSSA